MIPEAVLNQIQDRVDIVEIISARVPMKRAGRNFKACCPFHGEKTPSFMVNPDKQIFHCFGCGMGGNVFSFLMKYEKRDFREVVEELAQSVGIEIPKDRAFDPENSERLGFLAKANLLTQDFYHEYLLNKPEAEKARGYLKKRGISEAAIREFKIGFSPESWDSLHRFMQGKVPDKVLESLGLVLAKKDGGYYDRFRNRIIFPITDGKGVCVAFGGRVMDDSLPKYVNSPESEIYSKGRHLYGLFQARKAVRENDFVIVVEGYMDLVACFQAGVQNVVASLGTALTPDQVRLVKRHTKNVVMLYDADKAGEMATLRGLELFLEEGLEVKIVRLDKGHDPDSFIKEFGAARFREFLEKAKTLFDYKLSWLKGQFDVKSLEGKVKIANEMVVLFSKVRNEILRSAWTKELARELALSEEALVAEMKKGPGRVKEFKPEPAPSGAGEKPIHQAEKILIGLWLDNPRWIAEAKEHMNPADLPNAHAQTIAAHLFGMQEAFLSASHLMNRFKENASAVRVISEASAEIESLMDKEKAFHDCLLWLKRSRIHTRREGIRVELERAQAAGDKNRISKLLTDFNELNKGMKELLK